MKSVNNCWCCSKLPRACKCYCHWRYSRGYNFLRADKLSRFFGCRPVCSTHWACRFPPYFYWNWASYLNCWPLNFVFRAGCCCISLSSISGWTSWSCWSTFRPDCHQKVGFSFSRFLSQSFLQIDRRFRHFYYYFAAPCLPNTTLIDAHKLA